MAPQTDTYTQIWFVLIEKLRKEVAGGKSRKELARQIGVKEPTLGRWLGGQRGRNIGLIQILNILKSIGVDLDGLGRMLSPEMFEAILRLMKTDKVAAERLLDVLRRGGPNLDYLKTTLALMYERKQTPAKND
jgi:transcriptional regulator with XRE-family HTH domain